MKREYTKCRINRFIICKRRIVYFITMLVGIKLVIEYEFNVYSLIVLFILLSAGDGAVSSFLGSRLGLIIVL